MRLLILALITLNLLACGDSKPLKPTPNVSKVERSMPDECIDEDGKFNEDLGTDTLDCGNLPQ